MNATQTHAIKSNTMLVNTLELMEVLHSGRQTAIKVGEDAMAKVQIGKRVFWNLEKIRKYIDTISL